MEYSGKYFWEFARRNEEYVKDWKNYFKDHDRDLMKKLFSKWGIASFPESDNFELRWEEVPREIEDGWSDLFMKHQKDVFSALMQIFPEVKKDFPLTSFSHKIMTGAKDERKLDVPFDKEKNIYFLENEEGKKERAFYLLDYGNVDPDNFDYDDFDYDDFERNKSGHTNLEISQLTEENIPDEITLTIHNFKGFCRASIDKKRDTKKGILKEFEQQLMKWGDAAKELGLAEKATRLVKRKNENENMLLDEYLDVWEQFQRGKLPDEIAEEKFFDKGTFREPTKNRNINDDQKASIDKLNAIHLEMTEKFMKDGLSRAAAEEKADEYDEIKNAKDPDEKKEVAAIQKVYKYRDRAIRYINNPRVFLREL